MPEQSSAAGDLRRELDSNDWCIDQAGVLERSPVTTAAAYRYQHIDRAAHDRQRVLGKCCATDNGESNGTQVEYDNSGRHAGIVRCAAGRRRNRQLDVLSPALECVRARLQHIGRLSRRVGVRRPSRNYRDDKRSILLFEPDMRRGLSGVVRQSKLPFFF
jgi:hypothetical protein